MQPYGRVKPYLSPYITSLSKRIIHMGQIMLPCIFCNDSLPVFTRKMTHAPRRLSEQDLATLYLHTEAPLKLDALLQTGDMGKRDALQIDVHDVIGAQTPDLALMSL